MNVKPERKISKTPWEKPKEKQEKPKIIEATKPRIIMKPEIKEERKRDVSPIIEDTIEEEINEPLIEEIKVSPIPEKPKSTQ